MVQRLNYLKETPSQTAGPFVHIGMAPRAAGIEAYDGSLGDTIFSPATTGERITVMGHVLDGTGAPIKDLLIEVWQANAAGEYALDGHEGWGRVVPDFDTGLFSFETIKPGGVATPSGGVSAPHLNFWLVARGINIGLNTRMYFEDETEANRADPTLRLIEQPARRDTLVAHKTEGGYRFDIVLQGPGETVFFDF